VPSDRSGNVLLGAPSGAALPGYTPLAGAPRSCDITDIASLKRCVAERDKYDQLSLQRDVSCTSASDCCGAGNAPLIQLDNVSRRVFDGNGHTIRRGAGTLACNAIRVGKSDDVVIRNLTIDEGERAPPCELAMKGCPETILVTNSKQVRIDNTHIYFGKGYVVNAWGTDGFAFVRSSLSESGIIGLYVGHFKFAPSKNVVIAESVMARSRANGIALQGAYSDDPRAPVLVIGNFLNRNHWHGLWPVPNVVGGITTGGEMLVADGSNVRVAGNIIGDAACENCVPRGQSVTGIEFADVGPAPAGVHGLEIDDNYFYNGFNSAIVQNGGSIATDLVIDDNRVDGYDQLDRVLAPGARGRALPPENNPGLAQAGAVTYEAARLGASGRHRTARLPAAYPGAQVEAVFALSPSPRPGASPWPLLDCRRAGAAPDDFVSTDPNCAGAGKVLSILGYSFEPGHPSARPFYACRSGKPADDEFLSWDAKCEGQTAVGQPGYAIEKSAPSAKPG
jgi:hypothetical protein